MHIVYSSLLYYLQNASQSSMQEENNSQTVINATTFNLTKTMNEYKPVFSMSKKHMQKLKKMHKLHQVSYTA